MILFQVLFFGMCLSSFPNIIYWWDCPFPVVYSWLLCCKSNDHIYVHFFLFFLCTYFWALYSVPLNYVSGLMPIPYWMITIAFKYSLKWGNMLPQALFSLNFFGYLGFFQILGLFYFCENAIGIFDRDCMDSTECFV